MNTNRMILAEPPPAIAWIIILAWWAAMTPLVAVAEEDSWWSDPPTMEMIDNDWEDWPSWDGTAGDIDPEVICPAPLSTPRSIEEPSQFVEPDTPWEITVASWNLLNFSQSKAYTNVENATPRTQLLDRMADIVQPYDIVFFQEILKGWDDAFPPPLKTRMINNGFECSTVPPLLGWAGRQEIYAYCYKPVATGGVNLQVWSSDATAARTNLNAPVSGGSHCGAEIWMRAPAITEFRVQPPGSGPVFFRFMNNHTKPGYNHRYLPGGGKYPVTPSWYPETKPAFFPDPPSGNGKWPMTVSSVFFELQSINTNLGGSGSNIVILGDLNADCASLPEYQRSEVLTAQEGWTWYIEQGTNTGRVRAGGSSGSRGKCAYDRFILNNDAKRYYQGSRVHRDRIADRVNSKQVSDHFLVKLVLGAGGKKRGSSGTLIPVAIAEGGSVKRRKVSVEEPASGSTTRLEISAANIDMVDADGQPVTSAHLYILPFEEGTLFEGSAAFSLVDIRGEPDTISVVQDGSIALADGQLPTWTIEDGDAGLYRIVLDVGMDGSFRASDGDLVNSASAYDVIVHNRDMISMDGTVSTVGDNGMTRDLFSSGKALNIHFMAQDVPVNYSEVDVYVASRLRLNELYPDAAVSDWTWADAATWSQQIELAAVSVPIRLDTGPVVLDEADPMDFYTTYEVAPDQSVFGIAWPSPPTLFFDKAYATAPTTTSSPPEIEVYEAIAMFGDGCDADPADIGVSAEDFDLACNAKDPFVAVYGSAYNIVIDVNQNGFFDDQDLVDAQSVDKIADWFQSTIEPLGSTSDDSAAIAQYQSLMTARSNMLAVPPVSGTYGATTKLLSQFLYCNESLEEVVFEQVVQPGAQVGFSLLDETEYQSNQIPGATVERFVNYYVDASFEADSFAYTADEEIFIDESAPLTPGICFSAKEGFQLSTGEHLVTGDFEALGPLTMNVVMTDPKQARTSVRARHQPADRTDSGIDRAGGGAGHTDPLTPVAGDCGRS